MRSPASATSATSTTGQSRECHRVADQSHTDDRQDHHVTRPRRLLDPRRRTGATCRRRYVIAYVSNDAEHLRPVARQPVRRQPIDGRRLGCR